MSGGESPSFQAWENQFVDGSESGAELETQRNFLASFQMEHAGVLEETGILAVVRERAGLQPSDLFVQPIVFSAGGSKVGMYGVRLFVHPASEPTSDIRYVKNVIIATSLSGVIMPCEGFDEAQAVSVMQMIEQLQSERVDGRLPDLSLCCTTIHDPSTCASLLIPDHRIQGDQR